MEKKEWDSYADAEDYHSTIISPFQEGVVNPIFSDIEQINEAHEKTAADIGTGRGDFLPFLAEKFKHVHAIDFSKKMLERAKEKHSGHSNITFRQHDIRKLTSLNLNLDIAVAVNSVLHPCFEDVNKSFREIHSSLNKGGMFIGIFPSMEAVLHHSMLVYEREYRKHKDEKKALANTRRIVEKSKYNFITASYEDDGEKQKFYYRFELDNRLRQAGFKDVTFKKVEYPWGEQSGDYEAFHGRPGIWDWYVAARK